MTCRCSVLGIHIICRHLQLMHVCSKSISDLLIDFDMDVYEVNETDAALFVEVELVSVIEREIQLELVSEDGRATGLFVSIVHR